MAVRITIEARNREAAEVVARHLGTDAAATSRRGLGVIRVVARNGVETAGVLDAVSALLGERHDIGWVRVRYDDESHIFRSNGRHRG